MQFRSRIIALCAVMFAVIVMTQTYSVVAVEDVEAPQDLSLMEVGSSTSISSSAARPLQEVAKLLVEAHHNIARLSHTHEPYQVVSNHIRVHRHTRIFPKRVKPSKVNAQLVAPMEQPTIHDPHRFGTMHPIRPGRAYVTAEIVGEDGKPYAPRKQWKGITDEPEKFRSPFAKFVQPPKVGSSADVVNKDPNTKLTKLEAKHVAGLQLRLKKLLDQLGANVVWDHTKIANRRIIAEFEKIKTESRALMEEYELRTGVKTIAWQLQENDLRGLTVPNGAVTDIHFAANPELQARKLQRPGDRRAPPPLTDKELRKLQEEHGINVPKAKPKEQRVDVTWAKGDDGIVKAKVNLNVVDSKVPPPNMPPNMAARLPVEGTKYPSGRIGSPSKPVQIDVVAPRNEYLKRNHGIAQEGEKPDPPAAATTDAAPKINLGF